jgi:uroporphyrinogen-III synthase
VIFACGHHRRPELPDALEAAGHRVIPVVVYRMEPTPQRELPPLGPSLDAVVLTSPRAAELYLQGVGGMALPCPHWALGPTTRDAAAALGIDCRIPQQPTMESLAEDLCTI